jgi:putative restriction endonuclease
MFDTPVYKLLASNDTGGAPGHQGGIVIPAEIEDFFPDVVGTTSPLTPTADVPVEAELIVGGRSVGRVETRYQFQTWGGTRSPERRLTGRLGPLRNAAERDDMVLFARDSEKTDLMALTLLKAGSEPYEQILRANSNKRWGVVPGLPEPVGNREIRQARDDIIALGERDFRIFDENRTVLEQTSRKKARSAAFRRSLIDCYGPGCMASGDLLHTPGELYNLDAAHIVPVEVGGSDDPRNGLLFGKDLHWAFDRGLFTIGTDHEIIVSDFVFGSQRCEAVKRLEGSRLSSRDGNILAHPDALKWHRDCRFLR